MSWMIEHWWLTTALPYILFNMWLTMEVWPADDWSVDDAFTVVMVLVVGIWIMMGMVALYAMEDIGRVVDRRARDGWRNRGAAVALGRRLAVLCARWALATVTLLALYIVAVANIGWRPGRLESAAALWIIIAGSYFIAAHKWRHRNKHG